MFLELCYGLLCGLEHVLTCALWVRALCRGGRSTSASMAFAVLATSLGTIEFLL